MTGSLPERLATVDRHLTNEVQCLSKKVDRPSCSGKQPTRPITTSTLSLAGCAQVRALAQWVLDYKADAAGLDRVRPESTSHGLFQLASVPFGHWGQVENNLPPKPPQTKRPG